MSRARRCAALLGVGLGMVVGLGPVLAQSGAAGSAPGAKSAAPAALDRVTMKSGRVVEGTVLEETESSVKMRIVVSGITAETTFEKSDILVIEKGVVTPKGDAARNARAAATPTTDTPARSEGSEGPRVYRMVLDGEFARDISETPMRAMMDDARRQRADIVVIELNNDWSQEGLADRKDDESEYGYIFRAEKMDPIFNEEVEQGEWAAQPRIVFWVRNAMGGAAFLPLSTTELYFSSTGKLGGIGRIEDFTRATDRVVQEKWISAGLGSVEGLAIKGGKDPRIVRAMVRTDYVLSYRIEGGKPVLLERMPENADEVLLTDDGKEDRADTGRQLARGEGNDVLTLNADTAFKLGISRGTADSFEDLLVQLGVSRGHTLIKGRADFINRDWRRDVAQAERDLPRLWREFNEIQPRDPGGQPERAQARARRIAKINEMQVIIKKYEEVIIPQRLGVPPWADLETIKRQIQLEGVGDRPPPGGGGGGGR